MKSDETIIIAGEEREIHFCDQCELSTTGPYLYWEARDFTLCSLCLEKSYNLMFQPREHSLKNWAQKKQAIPAKLKKAVFERDSYRCRYCGSHKNLTADHVFPESRGGEMSLENLVTACSSCNSKKGPRTPEEAGMILKNISG